MYWGLEQRSLQISNQKTFLFFEENLTLYMTLYILVGYLDVDSSISTAYSVSPYINCNQNTLQSYAYISPAWHQICSKSNTPNLSYKHKCFC